MLGLSRSNGKLQNDLAVLDPAGVPKSQAEIELLWTSRPRDERDLEHGCDIFVHDVRDDQLHRRTDRSVIARTVSEVISRSVTFPDVRIIRGLTHRFNGGPRSGPPAATGC